MQDFLKMDIFFFVTTFVVVSGGILLVIALYYVIRILRRVDHVMENVSEESNDIRGDIQILRQKVREEGLKMKHIGDFVTSFAARTAKKSRAKPKHKVEDDI